MTDDLTAREMTLDEWIERLPEQHQARRELAELRATYAQQAQEIARLCEQVIEENELAAVSEFIRAEAVKLAQEQAQEQARLVGDKRRLHGLLQGAWSLMNPEVDPKLHEEISRELDGRSCEPEQCTDACEQEQKKLEALAAKRKAALKRFGRHHATCARLKAASFRKAEPTDCTCGFTAALAEES